jgi:hypothetical protein
MLSFSQFGILRVIGLMGDCGRITSRIARHIEQAFHLSCRAFLCIPFCLGSIDRSRPGFSVSASWGRFMAGYDERLDGTVPAGLEIPRHRETRCGRRVRI